MRRVRLVICFVMVCVMAIANFASADTVRGIDIEFVSIGNVGNAADTTGYGLVDHNYRIGKYEITANQWQIINAVTGISGSGCWGGNQPAASISWYNAAQFCNYLTSGDKFSGVYNFDQSGNFLGIDRNSAILSYNTVYVIPTEDEWYKAAYYKGNRYSMYANGTNEAPSKSDTCYGQDVPANGPWNVGTGMQEQNGTFDMMGNVWEWNETLVDNVTRGFRGDSFNGTGYYLASSARAAHDPALGYFNMGFRVASVPEPATLLVFGVGWMMTRKVKIKG